MKREVIWIDRDNRIDLILKADGEPYSLSSVTRMDLVIGDLTVTDITGENYPIMYAESKTEVVGKVLIRVGHEEDLKSGRYEAKLILYDTNNLNGLIWGSFPVEVRQG